MPAVKLSIFNFIISLFLIVKKTTMLTTEIIVDVREMALHSVTMFSKLNPEIITLQEIHIPLPCTTYSGWL